MLQPNYASTVRQRRDDESQARACYQRDGGVWPQMNYLCFVCANIAVRVAVFAAFLARSLFCTATAYWLEVEVKSLNDVGG